MSCIHTNWLLLCSDCRSFPSDGLEPSLNGLDRAGAVAGHALEEEQPGFLIQDGVGGPACVTCYILLDVPSENVLYMFLLKTAFHDELITTIYSSTCSQFCKEESKQVFRLPMQHLGYLGEISKSSFLAETLATCGGLITNFFFS